MNVSFKNGKAQVNWAKVGWLEVRNLLYTVDQNLWRTEHAVLRDDMASLRHDVERSATLTDVIRQQAQDLIERYNALDIKPKPTPAPTPKPKKPAPQDPKPKTPTPNDGLTERVKELEDRVDGHDARFVQAEANLKALNGAVGITKNPDGAWVPTEGGQFDRNAKVQQHLGYSRDNNGNVSFADRQFPFNATTGGLIGLVAAIVSMIIFMMITGATFTTALFWAIMIGLAAVVIGGLIAAPRSTHS